MDPSYACSILNTGGGAESGIMEVYLKDKDLTYHNWSYLIGDELCSICPLYPNGVNLLKIPYEEDERGCLPVTAGTQAAKIPCSTSYLGWKKKS